MQVFIGTVVLTGFTFAPPGWAFCDGSLLQISQYDALFALIGTTYGGDGQNTFALPDLRGRVPVGSGQLAGGSNYIPGQTGGAESVTINSQQYPTHTHSLIASSANAATGAPANALLAAGQQIYAHAGNPNEALNASACSAAPGSSQPHDNRQPYVAMSWMIALEGIFPSQS